MSFEGSACEAVDVSLMLGDSLSDELRSHVESCTRCRSTGEFSRGLHGMLGAGPKWTKGDRVLEQYEVLEEIGRGGQGAVYKARDLETALVVALKVVALAPNAVEEVRLATNITHPNVCRVNHTRSAGPFRIIVMEYVRGGSLHERMARGAIETEEALRIFRGVCAGVRAAHERDVLHLDLKPGNVLLRDGATAVVCDFGLAATSGSVARGGTDGYMAPEQIDGGRLDQRTDIYALGVMLRELVPDPPRRVRAAIARACAKDPDARMATVAALLDHLDGSRRLFVVVPFVVVVVAVAATAVVSWRERSNKIASASSSATKEVAGPPVRPPASPGVVAIRAPPMPEGGPSSSAGAAVAIVSLPTTTHRDAPTHVPTPAPPVANMKPCCIVLEALSKKHQTPNVMNVASACPALVAGGYGSEIKAMVEKNLSCNGLPDPCERTPVPPECR